MNYSNDPTETTRPRTWTVFHTKPADVRVVAVIQAASEREAVLAAQAEHPELAGHLFATPAQRLSTDPETPAPLRAVFYRHYRNRRA